MKHPRPFLTTKLFMFFGVALLLSSCAPAPSLAPSGALKTQLFEIKQQQQDQEKQLQQLQQQLTALLQQLRSQNIVTATIPEILETRDQLEPSTVPVETVPGTTNQMTFNQEAVTVAASASSYLAAFSSLAAGLFPAAETGFQEFLQDFPEHQYAPNARYWLAIAQLSQAKTSMAMYNFQKIIDNPNAQDKAPAALIQLAQIYSREGQQVQADNILEQLRNRYPESPEAQQLYRSNEPTN